MKKLIVLFIMLFITQSVFAVEQTYTQTTDTKVSIEYLKKEYNEISIELSRLSEIQTEQIATPLNNTINRIKNFKENAKISEITNKDELLKEIDETLASLYYSQALIAITTENNFKKAELLLIETAKYNNKYTEKFYQEANELISKQNYVLAEVFLTSFIETYNNSKYTLANAYRLRAKIRHNNLRNKFGAIEDNKKADELIK